MAENIIFTWSGGKDSTMALYELQKNNNYKVSALLTTVTAGYNRISMHGTHNTLLDTQSKSLNIPLKEVYISKNSSNKEYETKMENILIIYRNQGISSVAFGDIFLEDLRRYREEKLSKIGLKAIFPLWKIDTAELAQRFIALGFKAIITCIDSKRLNKTFVGRIFDKHFLSDLPSNVDPCGENGEFHSFVFSGPIFRKEISYKIGKIVLRDERFYYCDLLPA